MKEPTFQHPRIIPRLGEHFFGKARDGIGDSPAWPQRRGSLETGRARVVWYVLGKKRTRASARAVCRSPE